MIMKLMTRYFKQTLRLWTNYIALTNKSYIRDVFAFMPLILREYLRFQVRILLVIWRIGTISQKLIYINLYQKN